MKFISSVLSGFNQLTNTFKTLMIALVLGFAVLTVHDMRTTNTLDTYISHYNAYKKDTVGAVLRMNDSLKVVIAHHSQISAHAVAEADKQKARADSLAKVKPDQTKINMLQLQIDSLKLANINTYTNTPAGTIIAKQDTLIREKNVTIDNLTLRLNSKTSEALLLRLALTEKDTSIKLLTTSNDSLKKVIIGIPNAPKNPDKLFGLIPMPSRAATLLAGTAIGVAGTLYIIKH